MAKCIRLIMIVLFAGYSLTLSAVTLTVDWMPIQLQDSFQYQQTYAGTISSTYQSKLGFELNPGELGSVQIIRVDVGGQFKKGDMLAQLDNRLIHHQINQIKAQVNEVQANIKLARLQVKRLANLQKQNFSSVQALDEAQTKLEALSFQRTRLNHQINELNTRLQKRSIVAPFDGIVIERMINQGDIIQGGAGAFEVIDTKHYQINIGIPAPYLAYIQTGQQVDVNVDGQIFAGTIASISPNRDADTQSHNVLITTQVQDTFIPNNALATITLPVKVNTRGAWVPVTALQQSYRGLWNVYVLTPGEKQLYQVTPQPARLIFLGKKRAYIAINVANHSKIIRSGMTKVVPGELVNLRQAHE